MATHEENRPLSDDEYATLLSEDGTAEARAEAFAELVDAIGQAEAAEFWHEMTVDVEAGRSRVSTRDLAWILVGAHTHGYDVAEFVAHGAAYAANHLGGTDELLANRPGSWEAHDLRELLVGTVGPDDEMLHTYPIEPDPGDAERTTLAEQLRAVGAEQAARDEEDNVAAAERAAREADARDGEVEHDVDGED